MGNRETSRIQNECGTFNNKRSQDVEYIVKSMTTVQLNILKSRFEFNDMIGNIKTDQIIQDNKNKFKYLIQKRTKLQFILKQIKIHKFTQYEQFFFHILQIKQKYFHNNFVNIQEIFKISQQLRTQSALFSNNLTVSSDQVVYWILMQYPTRSIFDWIRECSQIKKVLKQQQLMYIIYRFCKIIEFINKKSKQVGDTVEQIELFENLGNENVILMDNRGDIKFKDKCIDWLMNYKQSRIQCKQKYWRPKSKYNIQLKNRIQLAASMTICQQFNNNANIITQIERNNISQLAINILQSINITKINSSTKNIIASIHSIYSNHFIQLLNQMQNVQIHPLNISNIIQKIQHLLTLQNSIVPSNSNTQIITPNHKLITPTYHTTFQQTLPKYYQSLHKKQNSIVFTQPSKIIYTNRHSALGKYSTISPITNSNNNTYFRSSQSKIQTQKNKINEYKRLSTNLFPLLQAPDNNFNEAIRFGNLIQNKQPIQSVRSQNQKDYNVKNIDFSTKNKVHRKFINQKQNLINNQDNQVCQEAATLNRKKVNKQTEKIIESPIKKKQNQIKQFQNQYFNNNSNLNNQNLNISFINKIYQKDSFTSPISSRQQNSSQTFLLSSKSRNSSNKKKQQPIQIISINPYNYNLKKKLINIQNQIISEVSKDQSLKLQKDKSTSSLRFSEQEIKTKDYIYKGETNQNGQRQGYGRLQYINGDFYQGFWLRNMMHGYGKYYLSNGNLIYQGNWTFNKFSGQGKLYNKHKKIFNGQIDGKNIKILKDCWSYYEGNFRQDQPFGRGKLFFHDNSYFQGNFYNGFPQGRGKFWKSNRTQKMEGIWVNGLYQDKSQI